MVIDREELHILHRNCISPSFFFFFLVCLSIYLKRHGYEEIFKIQLRNSDIISVPIAELSPKLWSDLIDNLNFPSTG
ncbi:hypothetical protein ACOSP7_008739 [Xanthoceras sorbifolium]